MLSNEGQWSLKDISIKIPVVHESFSFQIQTPTDGSLRTGVFLVDNLGYWSHGMEQ